MMMSEHNSWHSEIQSHITQTNKFLQQILNPNLKSEQQVQVTKYNNLSNYLMGCANGPLVIKYPIIYPYEVKNIKLSSIEFRYNDLYIDYIHQHTNKINKASVEFYMKLPLIVLSLFVYALTIQQCMNNGTYQPQYKACNCQPGFIGKQCNLPAVQINSTQQTITITKQYTYTYFDAHNVEQFTFAFMFCLEDSNISGLDLVMYIEQEGQDGDFQQNRTNQKKLLHVILGPSRVCAKILSATSLSSRRKINGQLPKIIFAFKIGILSSQQQSRKIVVSFDMDQFFSMNLFVNFFLSFIAVLFVGVCMALCCVIKQRIIKKRRQEILQRRRTNEINMIMPIKKYETLIEQKQDQNQISQYLELQCAICLCTFSRGQDIRKTPCNHIFHCSCLDSWCHNQLTCPICRTNFQQSQQPAVNQRHLHSLLQQLQRTNVNQVML